MSVEIRAPRAASGPLVLADIGGYTAFLRAVADAHANDAFADGRIPDAYAVMSTLLQGIVETLVPPFTLSKLEGDAVFAYAEASELAAGGPGVMRCIDACYADFRARLDAAHQTWTCPCDACARIGFLELKFIVHAGRFVLQEIAGSRELVGPDVVIAHRLLKNDAASRIGQGAYALVTAAAAADLGVATDAARPLQARYEHHPPIDAWVFPLPTSAA